MQYWLSFNKKIPWNFSPFKFIITTNIFYKTNCTVLSATQVCYLSLEVSFSNQFLKICTGHNFLCILIKETLQSKFFVLFAVFHFLDLMNELPFPTTNRTSRIPDRFLRFHSDIINLQYSFLDFRKGLSSVFDDQDGGGLHGLEANTVKL